MIQNLTALMCLLYRFMKFVNFSAKSVEWIHFCCRFWQYDYKMLLEPYGFVWCTIIQYTSTSFCCIGCFSIGLDTEIHFSMTMSFSLSLFITLPLPKISLCGFTAFDYHSWKDLRVKKIEIPNQKTLLATPAFVKHGKYQEKSLSYYVLGIIRVIWKSLSSLAPIEIYS